MNSAVATVNDPISEANMEGLSVPGAGGAWGAAGVALTFLVGGIVWAIGFWRKNGISNAEADARINSIEDLQKILAAERENSAAVQAALRQENAMLRERADKFAAERNEWMMKFSEMNGELRAVKAELEGMRVQLARMQEQQNGNH
ncbi:hypothetical protein [Bradyrhizobium elkanii]|uniref:hypothetical protein n=1 Tax=Bradyrhizobium elkanii TaxID=29448 RepID=UPI003519CE2E